MVTAVDTTDRDEDTTIYKVVVNDEEQYSIWPANRANALGWRDAGASGLRSDCLAFIADRWTDMRPRSLREQMAGHSTAS
jgi:MbtH protein